MYSVSHAHKWTNILAEELGASHRHYTYKTISGKQANDTLPTNQLTNTEPYIHTSNQDNNNMQKGIFVPSTYIRQRYLQRDLSDTKIYLRQAYSIQQKKKNLRQRQVFDTFDHIQQFSYIKQRHHINNQYCAMDIPNRQKNIINTMQQVREVQHNTPFLFMPPIQPVRTIFQPIPVHTIVQPPQHTYTIVNHTPQIVQKIRTLSQARKMAGLTSPNKNLGVNHQLRKINTNASNNQFAYTEKTQISPYQRLNSPQRYRNEGLAQSGVEEIPKITITEPPNMSDDNIQNMPEENIGRKIIAQTGIWKANLPSTKRGKDQNDPNEDDVQQSPRLELNQSLQIFNGQSNSANSSVLFSKAPKK